MRQPARAWDLLGKGSEMGLELVCAMLQDKTILRQLLELQAYDGSEFNGEEVDENGLFGYRYLDHYWTEAGRYAYLIRVKGKIAGFLMVREIELEGYGSAHSLAEIFVMRKYRRRGLGRRVATTLFDRFPGYRHAAQELENLSAQAFWQEMIGDYTGGEYVSEQGEDGPFQIFVVQG